MRRLNKVVPVILLFSSSSYSAQEFYWGGFVSQGAAYNSDNEYFSDENLSFELTQIALQGGYQVTDKLRFAGQVHYRNWGYFEDFTLDHLFADYTLLTNESSAMGVRAGRIKTELGIYNTTRDIPSARPSIFLPQSIYLEMLRDSETSYDGVSLYGNAMNSSGLINWSVAYGVHPVGDDLAENIFNGVVDGKFDAEPNIKLNLSWESAEGRWLVGAGYQDISIDFKADYNPGLSLTDGTLTVDKVTLYTQYFVDQWEFTIEYMYTDIRGDGFNPMYMGTPIETDFEFDSIMDGGYLQLRYFINEQLTLLGRYDLFFRDIDDRYGRETEKETTSIKGYTKYSKDFTTGVSWQASSNWLIKLEAHFVEGAGYIKPMARIDNRNVSDKYWQMYAAEVSYSF